MAHAAIHATAHVTFKLADVHCTGCADAVELALRASPDIAHVQLDWQNDVVHVAYHAGMFDETAIQDLIAAHYHSGHVQPEQPTELQRMQHLGHAVDVQPSMMGTKHDRMQYKLPATGVHAPHRAQAERRGATHQGARTGHATMGRWIIACRRR